MAGVGMVKLAVGIKTVEQFEDVLAKKSNGKPVSVFNRGMPKRAAEMVGGSIFWVFSKGIWARQEIIDIIQHADDGTGRKYASVKCEPELVRVAFTPFPYFKGFRYMEPNNAPADIAAKPEATGLEAMPPEMLQKLKEMGLV